MQELYDKFTKHTFVIPEFPPGNLDLWIRYQAHIFLMDQFKNKPELFFKLYIELVYTYSPFYKRAEFNHYKPYYPEQLFFDVEISTAPLRTLVTESGYPNRVLCYCYRYLLNEWNPQKIAVELGSMKLDDVLELFKARYIDI